MPDRTRSKLVDAGLVGALVLVGAAFLAWSEHGDGTATRAARLDRQADAVANDVKFRLGGRCLLEPAPQHATGRFENDWGERGQVVVVGGTAFVAAPVVEQGGGVLYLEGWAPIRMDWEAPLPDGPSWCTGGVATLRHHVTAVQGTVLGARGGPLDGATVNVCGQSLVVDADGRYGRVVEPGRCAVSAMHQEGYVRLSSDEVTLEVPPGQVVHRDIVVPVLRAGGVRVEGKASR